MEIISENLSLAWANAFLKSMAPSVQEICPLTITLIGIKENGPIEHQGIRNVLDEALQSVSSSTFQTHTTANTIFPISMWNPTLDASCLYDRYKRLLPVLKRADTHNKYGLYFERLISYGSTQKNQLKFIIDTYRQGNHRRSALQAAIYDPRCDQVNQRQRGFPCLQQVAFIPNKDAGELAVHGFYATQYLFEREYGNLLGLSRLGLFMAHELDLRLTKVSCTASVAKFGVVTKHKLRDLKLKLEEFLGYSESIEN